MSNAAFESFAFNFGARATTLPSSRKISVSALTLQHVTRKKKRKRKKKNNPESCGTCAGKPNAKLPREKAPASLAQPQPPAGLNRRPEPPRVLRRTGTPGAARPGRARSPRPPQPCLPRHGCWAARPPPAGQGAAASPVRAGAAAAAPRSASPAPAAAARPPAPPLVPAARMSPARCPRRAARGPPPAPSPQALPLAPLPAAASHSLPAPARAPPSHPLLQLLVRTRVLRLVQVDVEHARHGAGVSRGAAAPSRLCWVRGAWAASWARTPQLRHGLHHRPPSPSAPAPPPRLRAPRRRTAPSGIGCGRTEHAQGGQLWPAGRGAGTEHA